MANRGFTAEQLGRFSTLILEQLERGGPQSSADIWLGLGGAVPNDLRVSRTLGELIVLGRVTSAMVTRWTKSGIREARLYSLAPKPAPAPAAKPKGRTRKV